MKILFVASEAAPFVKSGGLGEVIGSLPGELRALDVDARVIIPKHKMISADLKKDIQHLGHIYIDLAWRKAYCGIEVYDYKGVPVYFVDNLFYFDKDFIYGYGDQEVERYAYFCKAVLEAINFLDFIPDVIHCHDWQTGLLPFLLKTQNTNVKLNNTKTLYTIHNLKYQGLFHKKLLADILGVGDEYFTHDKLEYNGSVNALKAGVVYTDLISTVSPSYANEIQQPYFGEGLDGLLRARKEQLFGVLNGIDYNVYNPKSDDMIYVNYDKSNWIKGKAGNKAELQKELGLEIKPTVPIISIISRLVSQKGLDLVACVLKDLLELDIQMIIHGSGETEFEDMFNFAAFKNRGKIASVIGYNDPLAHKIYAASDMFLMPSMFEPCGLGQLFALRYGTIPIVRETGGLIDTVESFNESTKEGNGFSFTNYNAHDMLFTIKRALSFYAKPQIWKKIVSNALESDNSWVRSAEKYKEIYDKLMDRDGIAYDI